MTQTISLERAASEAFDLLSEGENPEYDRAIFEVLARCFGQRGTLTEDRAMQMMLSMHCPKCDGPRAATRAEQCSECAPLFTGQTPDD